MSTLHLVRIAFDVRALLAFAIAEGVDDDDRGYAAHLALRRRFGAAAPQPFRVFDAAPSGPHLLGYATDPAALSDAAALPALDDRLDAIFPSPPTTKAMPASWREGARLGFEIRVRPVVRYGPRARQARIAAGQRGAAERDAFLAAIGRTPDVTPDRAAVYTEWLAQQLAGAAVVQRSALLAMRRLSTRRSSHGRPGAARIEGYEAIFTGTLAVADPAGFSHLLQRGVGRHAAFGFGMLALSPPRPG